ncbi:hypothetical protein [Alteromonas gilva]|uniref:Uncharacterized protein n=1 Tax=Alteromonas gilva TaxID=2987522 RepID=A0ABT5L611_9ALTE|nr:hypothetical protein [Alteromonas gilva]MDC8832500.1 hypothetical protein [Alteromonas gilva]
MDKDTNQASKRSYAEEPAQDEIEHDSNDWIDNRAWYNQLNPVWQYKRLKLFFKNLQDMS